jgi:hypothetical protein
MGESTRCYTTIVSFHQTDITSFKGTEKEKQIVLFLVLQTRNVGVMKGNNSRVTAWIFTRVD